MSDQGLAFYADTEKLLLKDSPLKNLSGGGARDPLAWSYTVASDSGYPLADRSAIKMAGYESAI